MSSIIPFPSPLRATPTLPPIPNQPLPHKIRKGMSRLSHLSRLPWQPRLSCHPRLSRLSRLPWQPLLSCHPRLSRSSCPSRLSRETRISFQAHITKHLLVQLATAQIHKGTDSQTAFGIPAPCGESALRPITFSNTGGAYRGAPSRRPHLHKCLFYKGSAGPVPKGFVTRA